MTSPDSACRNDHTRYDLNSILLSGRSGFMATAEATVASDPIQYEVSDHVATIWLNRPEVKNCVNWELLTQMRERVEEAAEDPDIRVVLFRGRGHTFCAGADLRMLGSEFVGTSTASLKLAELSQKTYDRIQTMSK